MMKKLTIYDNYGNYDKDYDDDECWRRLELSRKLLSVRMYEKSDDVVTKPLPTELNISQGYTASLRKLDPNLGRTMMVSLQVKALDSFQLALIDKFNKEVAVFELRKDPPKASVKYYAREMTADITTKDDLECSVPNNGTNFEFFIKFNLATGPLEYSCGNYSLILDATKAGHHLWENLTRVRLTGEGSYSSLTYVPVGIPSVATYRNDWQVFLPGKKYLRRGDVLEAAFKVKTTWHPYFFTLSASGSNDHWFCYVRTEHQLVRIYHGGPCWVVDYDWYEQGGYSFTTTNNIPPMSVDSIFLVQIVFADDIHRLRV
uniref:Uncharacterized protein n=1 Tax=Romanomermis culicivorax TaxID=13658 RepID=A0A915HLV9_ROMCU